jgi:hypothetical protein
MKITEKQLREIISEISQYTNEYRLKKDPLNRLVSMWEIGDVLLKNKQIKPHQIGWKIQELTNGIIKRPLVFRSYKIRTIWPDKTQLIKECTGIKAISNVIEMLPFLDPEKEENIPPDKELSILKNNMVNMDAITFNSYLKDYKQQHKDMGVGGTNIRDEIIKSKKFNNFIRSFQKIEKQLNEQIKSTPKQRMKFREKISEEALLFLSKTSQSIASGNHEKIKYIKTDDTDFNRVYNMFCEATNLKRDEERARIRRVIPIEHIIDIGIIAYAISSEKRKDEIERTKTLQKIINGE